MSQLKVSVLGTGTIGTSLALALKASNASVEIVGHDREYTRAGRARKMGALDRTSWNLHKAVEGADLIILAMPLAEIRDTLLHIGETVRPDAVIMDVAELSKGFALVPSPTARSEALDLASKVVQVIGAKPLFITAEEHDSMMAAMRHMPTMLALAYGQVVFGSPTWREMREMANEAFFKATALPTNDVDELYTLLLNNRAALRHWVQAVQEALATLLTLLESDPTEEQEKHEQLRNLLVTLLEHQQQWEWGANVEQVERFDKAMRQAKDSTSVESLLFGRFLRILKPGDDK